MAMRPFTLLLHKKFLLLFAVLLTATLVAATGCSSGVKKVEPLRIWTGMDAEYPILQRQCQEFSKRTGIQVETLKVPFKNIRDKFLIAGPAGLGPDVLVGPHDWVGVLATAGLLSPLPKDAINPDDYFPVTIQSVRFRKELYSAPLCMECIGLFRNTDLMPKAPATMAELITQAEKIQKDSHNEIKGFYFEIREPYFALPFLYAEGAYLLGEKNGDYDPFDVGLANEGAMKGAQFLQDLQQKYRLINSGASENISRTLFLEKKCAVVLNGPWFLKEVKKENQVNGLHYCVDPFPVTDSGNLPRPLVGVQGLMLNKMANNPEQAVKLIQFLSQDENIKDISEISGRPPAKLHALEMLASNKDIATFARIAQTGVPMPAHPAVGAVWEPLKQTLELIADGKSPQALLPETQSRIVDKIELMLE